MNIISILSSKPRGQGKVCRILFPKTTWLGYKYPPLPQSHPTSFSEATIQQLFLKIFATIFLTKCLYGFFLIPVKCWYYLLTICYVRRKFSSLVVFSPYPQIAPIHDLIYVNYVFLYLALSTITKRMGKGVKM